MKFPKIILLFITLLSTYIGFLVMPKITYAYSFGFYNMEDLYTYDILNSSITTCRTLTEFTTIEENKKNIDNMYKTIESISGKRIANDEYISLKLAQLYSYCEKNPDDLIFKAFINIFDKNEYKNTNNFRPSNRPNDYTNNSGPSGYQGNQNQTNIRQNNSGLSGYQGNQNQTNIRQNNSGLSGYQGNQNQTNIRQNNSGLSGYQGNQNQTNRRQNNSGLSGYQFID